MSQPGKVGPEQAPLHLQRAFQVAEVSIDPERIAIREGDLRKINDHLGLRLEPPHARHATTVMTAWPKFELANTTFEATGVGRRSVHSPAQSSEFGHFSAGTNIEQVSSDASTCPKQPQTRRASSTISKPILERR